MIASFFCKSDAKPQSKEEYNLFEKTLKAEEKIKKMYQRLENLEKYYELQKTPKIN